MQASSGHRFWQNEPNFLMYFQIFDFSLPSLLARLDRSCGGFRWYRLSPSSRSGTAVSKIDTIRDVSNAWPNIFFLAQPLYVPKCQGKRFSGPERITPETRVQCITCGKMCTVEDAVQGWHPGRSYRKISQTFGDNCCPEGKSREQSM